MQWKDWITSNPIAHRGLHDVGMPENSMSAFETAIRAGASIELDVQLTKDGQVVVFHDDNVFRMTGVNRDIRKMTVVEIKKLRLAGTDCAIPTFAQVLALVNGKVPLLVEVKKHYKMLERVVCEMLRGYAGDYAIQAFNPLVIRSIHKIDPSIGCGLLSSCFDDMKLLRIKKAAIRNARLFFMAKPDFLSFEIHSFPNRRIAGFRNELGLPVLGWTVKTKEELVGAKAFCDNIIFENLSALQEHFHLFGENLIAFEESIAATVKSLGGRHGSDAPDAAEDEQTQALA